MASSSNAASGPRMTLTLSRSIASCALVFAPAGVPPVSAEISSTLRPAKALFFSFRKVRMPCSIWMPPWASGPVLTVSKPILNGAACASTMGAFNAARPTPAPASPFNTFRRCTVMVVSSSGPLPFRAILACSLTRFCAAATPRASELLSHDRRAPAIDVDGRAGDVGPRFGHEETGEVRELLGPPGTAERNILAALVHVILELDARLGGGARMLVGFDESDQHRIHQHIERPAFAGEHFGQRHAGG